MVSRYRDIIESNNQPSLSRTASIMSTTNSFRNGLIRFRMFCFFLFSNENF